MVGHIQIALYHSLSSLHEVFIAVDERVHAFQIVGLLHLHPSLGSFLAQQLQGRQQRSTAVASLLIIGVKHIVCINLHADEAQQVVVEHLTVHSFHHNGFQGLSLHGG